VYSRFRTTPLFKEGTPWLLRFFDQIRFYPVDAAELLEMRHAFSAGRLPLEVHEETFRSADYNSFLAREKGEIAAFRAQQQAAFAAERERWQASGQGSFAAVLPEPDAPENDALGDGARVQAHVPGSVWKVVARAGQQVSAGDPLVILESMKMEITVAAPTAGVISQIVCREGQSVSAGQVVALLQP
jgi:urea carboxylase